MRSVNAETSNSIGIDVPGHLIDPYVDRNRLTNSISQHPQSANPDRLRTSYLTAGNVTAAPAAGPTGPNQPVNPWPWVAPLPNGPGGIPVLPGTPGFGTTGSQGFSLATTNKNPIWPTGNRGPANPIGGGIFSRPSGPNQPVNPPNPFLRPTGPNQPVNPPSWWPPSWWPFRGPTGPNQPINPIVDMG